MQTSDPHKNALEDNFGCLIWTQRDKTLMPIVLMSDDHLQNCIKMTNRRIFEQNSKVTAGHMAFDFVYDRPWFEKDIAPDWEDEVFDSISEAKEMLSRLKKVLLQLTEEKERRLPEIYIEGD